MEKIFLSVVIPCQDEEKTIGLCLQKAMAVFKKLNLKGEIIVVDNNSKDRSAEIAKSFSAKVIFVKERGYENALAFGLNHAKGEYIIVADADGEHNLSEIEKFIENFKKGWLIISGARKTSFKNLPLIRQIGVKFLTFFFNINFNTRYYEIFCGFKGFHKSFIKVLNLKAGDIFPLKFLISAQKEKIPIKEIDVSYTRRKGTSKVPVFKVGFKALWLIFKEAPIKNLFYLLIIIGIIEIFGILFLMIK